MDDDIKKLFRTVKEDLVKAKNSLSKVLTSYRINILYPNIAIYMKIHLESKEVPLKIQIKVDRDDSKYQYPALSDLSMTNNESVLPKDIQRSRGSLVNLKMKGSKQIPTSRIIMYLSES
jgi:hypothetical protein